MKIKTRKIVVVGMFCAMAFALSAIGNAVPIRFAGFLSYDPKDVIIVIAGFALGPISAIAISIIVPLIELISISTTGPIGLLMNIISSLSFALIPALLYRKKRTFKRAIIGLLISLNLTVAIMLLWNLLITPYHMGVPREAVKEMLLPVFLPFNYLKYGLNTLFIILLYKPLTRALKRMLLLPPSNK
ncbi:MAG: ECF transporter S component [Clostridia bacterium]|nr:ECF transporter S component [Clostridia bacterium]